MRLNGEVYSTSFHSCMQLKAYVQHMPQPIVTCTLPYFLLILDIMPITTTKIRDKERQTVLHPRVSVAKNSNVEDPRDPNLCAVPHLKTKPKPDIMQMSTSCVPRYSSHGNSCGSIRVHVRYGSPPSLRSSSRKFLINGFTVSFALFLISSILLSNLFRLSRL
jgi:hypothetical protein